MTRRVIQQTSDTAEPDTRIKRIEYFSKEIGDDGNQRSKYQNPNDIQNSFQNETAANGKHTQSRMNGDQSDGPLDSSHSPGHSRESVANGVSSSAGGHRYVYSGNTSDTVVASQASLSAGGDILLGSKKTNVNCRAGCAESDQRSDATKFQITSGDKVQKHKGNMFQFVENDYGVTIGKNKYENVKGEFGLHIQDGNWDTKVDGGEAKFEVQNKITFKVGTSTIVMEPGKITITADRIDLNP